MKEKLEEFIVESLGFLPAEIIVIIVSALPILELRGGLPLAYLHYDFSLLKSSILSILGNILPIIPILILFQPLSKWLRRFNWYRKMYDWLYNRTMKKSGSVEKFGAIGLMLFTALPLPTTGAYSACVAAIIFGIRFRYAFLSITAGVLIAALIVSLGLASFSLF
ncbi:COG2426 family protein [Metabacillus litoralis]|uniref:COG2426 family protein n=1 Tax=Metabacillus litoralis TaxID=152268 RepID=UPI001CFEAD73|nr:small multi-drug export protein [Metabacillus litoralis]